MEDLLLGIDIGTSACKVAVFRQNGTVAAQSNAVYQVDCPHAGWAQQNPDEWWEAVCRAIRDLEQQGVNLARVVGIGVDGQSWSAIPLDADGKVLCPTPIWMDTRSAPQCAEMIERCGAEVLFASGGNPVQPMYTMPKVLWYQENLPDVYRAADKILQSNSFIVFRLTGVVSQDPSQGYGWSCYDMRRGVWDRELCRQAGIEPGLLPDIVPCHAPVGNVTAQAAALTGLRIGTPVVAGGLDAACGTLGAGVVQAGQTQEQGGQAGGMSLCMDTCRMDPALILGAHVVPDLWLLQGGTVGGGGAMNWFEREFGAEERALARKNGTNSFVELDRQAERIPAGSEGMVFLPYLAGERSPIWNAQAKGVFYGASFATGRTHFARAVMEGVAYSLRHTLEVAEKAGAKAGVLRAMGGAANSRLWTQIKADVTGKTIEVPSSDTTTALGAAILAGMGTGVYESFAQAVERTVQVRRVHMPNPENKSVYDARYAEYRSLYERLKPLMKGDSVQ